MLRPPGLTGDLVAAEKNMRAELAARAGDGKPTAVAHLLRRRWTGRA